MLKHTFYNEQHSRGVWVLDEGAELFLILTSLNTIIFKFTSFPYNYFDSYSLFFPHHLSPQQDFEGGLTTIKYFPLVGCVVLASS